MRLRRRAAAYTFFTTTTSGNSSFGHSAKGNQVSGLLLLVYAKCMRPYATIVCGLNLLVYAAAAALSY